MNSCTDPVDLWVVSATQSDQTEFNAGTMLMFCHKNSGTKAAYIEPGSPGQTGFVESFNSRFRDEFLNTELFTTVMDTQGLTNRWHWWEDNTLSARSCCMTSHSHCAWTNEGGRVNVKPAR
jgi:hypothetical protein